MKKSLKTIAEIQQEQERLAEVLMVLEDMFQRENVAAKRIIGCLYDIAIVNLINDRVPFWPLNPLLKGVLKFPKPLAQELALKCFVQPKCPQLITKWMSTLVVFPKNAPPMIPVKNSDREIRKLQHQIRLLSGTLLLTILCSTSGIVWVLQKDSYSTAGTAYHQRK